MKCDSKDNVSHIFIVFICTVTENWFCISEIYICVRGRNERLLLNHAKTLGLLASGGEEFNLGPEMRLDRSEILYNKVLLKYKGNS